MIYDMLKLIASQIQHRKARRAPQGTLAVVPKTKNGKRQKLKIEESRSPVLVQEIKD